MKLRDPTPPVVEEREVKPDTPEVMPERPNIQMSTKPEPNPTQEELIKSENTLVDTPKIDPSSQVTVVEAPTELDLVSEDTTWAEDVIAVETSAVAQHVIQKEPPPSQRKMGRFNQAPKASVAQTSVPKSFGDPNAATDGPVGPMDINLFGSGTSFITNTPFGSVQARTAVDLALAWLARHQEADGAWRAEKHQGQESATLAMTGLATLAFLGANYHTRSKHVYRLNVIRAVDYMLKNQESDGRVCKGVTGISMSYTHAICSTALCEAYGRARDETLQAAAQKAINATVAWQNNDGGWRYQPKVGPSDSSVTAWFMQALKAGKMAQLKFDNGVLSRGQGFIDSLTDNNGSKGTSGAVTYILEGPEATRGGGNSHPALTSAGMLVRQFQRVPIQSEVLQKGAELSRAKGLEPDWKKKDFYRWYYATYAMHNMGGEHRLWWEPRHPRSAARQSGEARRAGRQLGSRGREAHEWWAHLRHRARRAVPGGVVPLRRRAADLGQGHRSDGGAGGAGRADALNVTAP